MSRLSFQRSFPGRFLQLSLGRRPYHRGCGHRNRVQRHGPPPSLCNGGHSGRGRHKHRDVHEWRHASAFSGRVRPLTKWLQCFGKDPKSSRDCCFHYCSSSLTRKGYRSLMGSLRHVATCIRPARPCLQRLRQREAQLHHFQSVSATEAMRDDLLWWWLILHTLQLNGVYLEYFNALPPPDIVVKMDASAFGLCALDVFAQEALTYTFTTAESELISEFNAGAVNGFDINFRELSVVRDCRACCARVTGYLSMADGACIRIDNTPAVAWPKVGITQSSAQDISVC
ncbi:hypothetical protein GQ600_17234 [Phytophthora cactorum]|nr:hypothetical protein GQ600_17234 [Phytophthora cactorum]